jgi:hypothetical protein
MSVCAHMHTQTLSTSFFNCQYFNAIVCCALKYYVRGITTSQAQSTSTASLSHVPCSLMVCDNDCIHIVCLLHPLEETVCDITKKSSYCWCQDFHIVVKLLSKLTGRNACVNVTHEHGWRVILQTIEQIDWKKCLCKMLHMSINEESYLKPLSKSTGRNVYVNVTLQMDRESYLVLETID